MVAPLPKPELSASCLHLLEMIREAGLPGDEEDHAWIARRIWHHAQNLGEGEQRMYLAELLLTGLLIERSVDPSQVSQLNGRDFPEHFLRAVPPLLKIGYPVSSWRLVEKGVLAYEGAVWGGEGRWVIKGQNLKPLLDEWHELGEQLVMQHIARGLIPLVHDTHRPPQIKMQGVDRKTGRKWLQELRSCLKQIGGEPLPHLMIDV